MRLGIRQSIAAIAITTALTIPLVPGDAAAEEFTYYRKGTFAVGGGFNAPAGNTKNYLNSSGTMIVSGGRRINAKNTLQAEWNHNWLTIAPEVIDRAESDSVQFDNAHASLWSVTLNWQHRFREQDIVPWITGGGGYYKRNIQLTQNTLVYYPPFYDPYWGWIGGGWAPGEAISGERADAGYGFNVGFGIDFAIEGRSQLFLDVRWHHAYLDGADMDIVPILAGVRW